VKFKLNKKHSRLPLIAGEFAFGVALSLIFFSLIFSNNAFFGKSYASGIFMFFGTLSLVFFVAVISVGIYGAVISRQANKIGGAIVHAILYWFLSLILYILFGAIPFVADLGVIPFYIVLIGIIVGFNKGLSRQTKNENDVR
jgi:hypothetical protein